MLNTPTHLSHFHPKFLSLDETLVCAYTGTSSMYHSWLSTLLVWFPYSRSESYYMYWCHDLCVVCWRQLWALIILKLLTFLTGRWLGVTTEVQPELLWSMTSPEEAHTTISVAGSQTQEISLTQTQWVHSTLFLSLAVVVLLNIGQISSSQGVWGFTFKGGATSYYMWEDQFLGEGEHLLTPWNNTLSLIKLCRLFDYYFFRSFS